MTRTTLTGHSRLVPAVALAAVALIGLSACGSSSTASDQAAAGTQPGSQSTTQSQGQFGGGRFPGASGQVAEVDGKTLQVQSPQSGQVAVTYTGSTKITAQVKAALADVKVGSCVMVSPARSASGTSSPQTGAASTGPIAAGDVRITAATGGSCTGGFRGGVRGGFRAGSRPSGAPSAPEGSYGSYGGGAPSGAASGGPAPRGGFGGGFGFGAFGKVTAVSGTGFTVASVTFDRSSGASASPTTQNVQVTVSSSTTYSTTAKASGSALKVGVCVTAMGTSDDTGAVTATAIQVTQPISGQCSSFGGGFGGRRG